MGVKRATLYHGASVLSLESMMGYSSGQEDIISVPYSY